MRVKLVAVVDNLVVAVIFHLCADSDLKVASHIVICMI